MSESDTSAPRRRLLHTRTIACHGYARSDGLFDIEAHMRDTKADTADLLFKTVPAGEPIHEMRITLTIDSTGMIHAAVASTDSGPSPYCAEINAAYASLAGVRIGAGFMKQVRERVGGRNGCTHLTELLGPLATTALQTLMGSRGIGGNGSSQRDEMIDNCHAWRADGEIVRFLRDRSRPKSCDFLR